MNLLGGSNPCFRVSRYRWIRWWYQIFDIFNFGTFQFLKLQGPITVIRNSKCFIVFSQINYDYIVFISNDPPSFFLIQYINDFHEFILNSESFFATMTHFSLPRINNFWANSVRFNYFSCESTISFAIISYISRTFSCFLQPWEISVNSLSFPRAHDLYHYVFGNSP